MDTLDLKFQISDLRSQIVRPTLVCRVDDLILQVVIVTNRKSFQGYLVVTSTN
jgi:hypothetical protein